MADQVDRSHLRLAELVAGLSLGIDLGFGQPMEHVLRQCLIAMRLAEQIGLDDDERACVYYTALLINVGCHTDAHEQAKWFGDDIDLKAVKYDYALGSARGAVATMRKLGAGRPPLQRFRIGLEFAIAGHRDVAAMVDHHAQLARSLATQLELPQAVVESLGAAYEQWDGKGWPGELSGDEVPVAARIAQLSEFSEVAFRVGGVAEVRKLMRTRGGTQFDPTLAKRLDDDAEIVLADLDAVVAWDAVVGAEPGLVMLLSGDQFDAALQAIADFVDLKSPYTLGHASAVAELATAAGERLSLSEPDMRTLRRAALVHNFGRLGISNSIWDKRGPLGAGEWERVRMQPYLTERMLHQSPGLAAAVAVAVQHRERLDGSGYPRALQGSAIGRTARVLAAAEAYQAMREPRPQRDALEPTAAAAELQSDVKAGRLDAEACEAVLAAAGHRVPRRREGLAGLTPREIDVLRRVARGHSNKQIAEQLVISPKTVANHVDHIYSKIDASTRVSASLFAVRHGLLPESELLPAAPAQR
ncbi:MAG: HD domain-containing phosphohydrolase [Solirubrobacterales bacterium]